MSRISRRFDELRSRGERALIAYTMLGYPSGRSTLAVVRGLVRGGADMIEIGFPFSDPLADGPVIQHAGTASIRRGTTTDDLFGTVRAIRAETDVPLILMTYANILYRMGYESFVRRATDAGIDGFIIPDMSIEESDAYLAASGGADTIFLVSPNTSEQRIRRIAERSTGFLYMVAVYGTTGVKRGIDRYTIRAIRDAKKALGGSIPLGVGFGVSTPDDVSRYVSAGADAVIVGSALLDLVGRTSRGDLESKVASFARRLKRPTRVA